MKYFNTFSSRMFNAPEDFVKEYVPYFMEQEKITGVPAEHRRKFRTLIICASVLLFIGNVFYALYHKAIWLPLLAAVAIFVLCILSRKVPNNFYKEVLARPDEDVDQVIYSQSSGFVQLSIAKHFLPIIVAAVLIPLLLFARPHFIFEENNFGFYSVRYYTLGLIADRNVIVPETHNGKPVTEIRGETFYHCKRIKTVTLPSTISEIRGDTFTGCSSLTSIVIPKGVSRIGAHAFQNCFSLSDVEIPSSLREIGSSGFRDCHSLKSIKLPTSCQVAGNAFKGSPTQITWE